MKLMHITIAVRDLEESLKFYRDILGLPLQRRFPSGDAEIAFLGDGETVIELLYSSARADVSFSADISLGFAVASLTETTAELQRKGIEVGDILQPNPHVRFAFITDPNGLRIQFVESIQ